MHIATDRFTRTDYDRLPEGFPAQLIDGFLVKEPSPTYVHGGISLWFAVRLVALVGLDRVRHAPADVGVDEFNVYQPDVVVLREPAPPEAHYVGIPVLAVEVLSPSTARRDRRIKCPHLLRAGVAEVWLVDPVTETVEVHDASGVRTATGDEVVASRAVPGFEVVPSELFPRRDRK